MKHKKIEETSKKRILKLMIVSSGYSVAMIQKDTGCITLIAAFRTEAFLISYKDCFIVCGYLGRCFNEFLNEVQEAVNLCLYGKKWISEKEYFRINLDSCIDGNIVNFSKVQKIKDGRRND